jgi:C4-dicarboxylate-specific signal transduction histidine kinase
MEEEQNRMMAAMKVNLESEVKQRTAELTNQKEELQLTLSELKKHPGTTGATGKNGIAGRTYGWYSP